VERSRIAFVTPGSFPVPSPNSSSVEQAVNELACKLQASAEVDVYGCRHKGYPARDARGGITYIRVSRNRKNGYAAGIVRQLRKRRYAFIQVENRPRLAAYVKGRLPNTPVWLFLHSLSFVSTVRVGAARLLRWLTMPDRIVVNSHYLKEEICRRFPALAPKVLVNHLGVNPDQFTSRWTEEAQLLRIRRLEELGLAGRRIILYVGRLIPLKGVHHLLKAMPAVLERTPDAVLIVVGGAFYGSKRETLYVRSLKQLARRMPGSIRFVPYVPHDRIQEWFQIADLAVVPTPRREAFGLVNVEAMATGIPVVACAAGGIMEVVEHGSTGFLVPPVRLEAELPEYIGRILNDPGLQLAMGTGCLDRVRNYFAWEHAACRMLGLLGENGIRLIG
jgi:spore coat protein SA